MRLLFTRPSPQGWSEAAGSQGWARQQPEEGGRAAVERAPGPAADIRRTLVLRAQRPPARARRTRHARARPRPPGESAGAAAATRAAASAARQPHRRPAARAGGPAPAGQRGQAWPLRGSGVSEAAIAMSPQQGCYRWTGKTCMQGVGALTLVAAPASALAAWSSWAPSRICASAFCTSRESFSSSSEEALDPSRVGAVLRTGISRARLGVRLNGYTIVEATNPSRIRVVRYCQEKLHATAWSLVRKRKVGWPSSPSAVACS